MTMSNIISFPSPLRAKIMARAEKYRAIMENSSTDKSLVKHVALTGCEECRKFLDRIAGVAQ